MSNQQEQTIRERAYVLWEQAGCPDGDDLNHWLSAEAEIRKVVMANLSSASSDDPSPAEGAAIEQLMHKVIVPILYDRGDAGIDQIGTGTLFCIADRHFIVTAQHIFDNIDPKKIAYPETPRGITPYTLGNYQIVTTTTGPDFDIALVELLEGETISRLKSGWQFPLIEKRRKGLQVGQVLCIWLSISIAHKARRSSWW
jgi:hypothetical protein